MKPLFMVTGRSTAASKVNAFIWNHYPMNTMKLNNYFLANKCMKLWNICTRYSECRMFKKKREKLYFSTDVGDIAVRLNYSVTLSIYKLLNLKCHFTLYHERHCANLSLSA